MGNDLIDFKLIAIRPLNGCDKKLLKVLKENQVYQFYHDYTFIYKNGDKCSDVIDITYCPTVPESLYSNKNEVSISVSAIVGKNGSGKSSLLELLFATIYNISVDEKILVEVENDKKIYEELERISNLIVEIYYSINNEIHCLKADTSEYRILKLQNKNFTQIEKKDKKKLLNDHFFYTIAINYSLYGLNSSQIGIWIKALFHKNDGYQTPVVINPYRQEGNIDINREFYLAKQRLLSNILKPNQNNKNENYHYLTDSQRVESISFSLNEKKIECAFRTGNKDSDEVSFDELFKTDNKDDILGNIYDIFFGKDKRPVKNVIFKVAVEKYLIKKLIQIARTYPDYNEFFHDSLLVHIGEHGSTINNTINYNTHFEKLPVYIGLLKEDKSHITFKLRQALNYLFHDILQENKDVGFQWKIEQDENSKEFQLLTVSVDKLSRRIENLKVNQSEIIEHIPPSLFNIELHLVSKDNSPSLFSELSSGEQQLIHTIQSIIYQAINVNSVHFCSQPTESRIKYNCITIILDEVELYFHPEFQRAFVLQLINAIKRINLSKIKNFNILFSTHSPFILSDIPSANILKIEDGIPHSYVLNKNTFGANIHTLLHDDFFMKKGFIGEFAKDKIQIAIDWIKIKEWETNKTKDDVFVLDDHKISPENYNLAKELTEDEVWDTISLIGEQVVFKSLSERFYRVAKKQNGKNANWMQKMIVELQKRQPNA